MTTASINTGPPAVAASTRHGAIFQRLAGLEKAAMAVIMGGLIVLPLTETLLRSVLHRGIAGADAIVQHLVLIVGMLGAAMAAGEGRLIALSNVEERLLHGLVRRLSRIFTSTVSCCICLLLALAASQFVQSEREFPVILAYGVPVWWVELVLPLGFLAIAGRVAWGASSCLRCRVSVLALAGACILAPLPHSQMTWITFGALAIASVLGIPAFATLGGAGLILFWSIGQPIASIPVGHYSLITNPTLPTLPLFTLAGFVIAEGNAPARLIEVFRALFGRVAGGPVIVTVLVCAFFTSFTGASGVTILALGGLLMPMLLTGGLKEKDALGLITGSGSLGLLLPPCLPLILFAIVAKVPMQQMFLAGFLPAIVMIAATGAWGVWRMRKCAPPRAEPFQWLKLRKAAWAAKWELLLPVITLLSLFSGLATPVEASAITALYVIVVEVLVHRELHVFRDLPRAMASCGLVIGGVLLILGVALGFTNYLVDAQVPARAVAWTTNTIHSRILFLLALNAFLLVVGCLMDIFSAIVIQVPLLLPVAAAFGIDPIHLGVVFLANLEVGYLTPPIGLNLLLSSYRFGVPIPRVLRAVLPIVVVMSIGVLLITYVPSLTTAIPRWLIHDR
jgi:tripartite ATP-independent transporter DctM subunit